MLENILLIGGIGFIVYMFFIKENETQKLSRKATEGNSVRDVFLYKEITKEGLIDLGGHQYRQILEIIPTNLMLKSPEEEATVWEEWRRTIDSIHLPMIIISQSRIMDMADYISNVESKAVEIHENKNENMYNYSQKVLSEFREMYQEQGRRERKYFVILQIDGANYVNEQNSSLGVSNAAGAAMLGKLGKKQKYTDEEIKNISLGELENSVHLLVRGLSKCGVTARQLNKLGVLDYINNVLSRDIAGIHSINRMDKAGVFNFTPTSLTAEHYFPQILEDNIITLQEQSLFTEPDEYLDEVVAV